MMYMLRKHDVSLPARELGLIVAETLERAFLMRRFSSPRLPRSKTNVFFALDRSVHRLVRDALTPCRS